MFLLTFLTFPFLLFSQQLPEYEDIILTPLENKKGPISVLYFIQGAYLSTSQYIPLLSKLQSTVSFPLWIGIPQCPGNVAAIPNCISNGVDRITKKMKLQGLIKEQFNFYSGHSLGGAMLPGYVENQTNSNGMILLGSYLIRTYKTGQTTEGRPQVEFPVPVLTIGGELDGLCRITRITENLYTQVTFSENPDLAATILPVTVIPGMNHMEFASGEVPSFVKDHDLQADIPEEEAQEKVTADMATFLSTLVYPTNPTYIKTLKNRVAESQKFVESITNSLLMESYEQFLPPCYCETPVSYTNIDLLSIFILLILLIY